MCLVPRSWLCFIFFIMALGCKESAISKKAQSDRNIEQNSKTWSMFFLAYDPLSSTRMSSLYRVTSPSEDSYSVEVISAGEGSDSWLKFSNENYFLINRSQGQQNLRHLNSNHASLSLSKISQVGDPYDLVFLDHGDILFSNYTEGSISVLNWDSKSLKNKISCVEMACDQNNIQNFHPTSLHPITNTNERAPETNFWAVYHDSLDFTDGKLISNGSQQIFVFSQDASSNLRWLDKDDSIPGVQGIPLKASFPAFLGEIKWNESMSLLSLGLCSRLVDTRKTCKSAVEILTKDLSVETIFDLDSYALKMNGASVLDPEKFKIYASVEYKENQVESTSYSPAIVELDLKNRTVHKVYEYNKKFGGYGMLVWDSLHELLWIGDADENSKTVLRAFDPISKRIVFESNLVEIPFVGVSNQESSKTFTANMSGYL